MKLCEQKRLKVGDVLYFDYGATSPTLESIIYNISECGRLATVKYLDDLFFRFDISHVKEMGETSANGSPIGIFVLERVSFEDHLKALSKIVAEI